eukprot:CAMPEP_0115101276 /NCGR_PEP_ID=MMETSP0227-20121206/33115_1 /TAXON_ID=89957 /ORGANISM="Polarella glacialis, Strain CCMP 1383" /LENGTH=43 /DNA_ID= /DNA_START= /DNA_END= /DNA_ORIENTATION=
MTKAHTPRRTSTCTLVWDRRRTKNGHGPLSKAADYLCMSCADA